MTTAERLDEDRLLLRPVEAARQLGISRAKVYALIAQGTVPGVVRITGSSRISRAALERWISESERP